MRAFLILLLGGALLLPTAAVAQEAEAVRASSLAATNEVSESHLAAARQLLSLLRIDEIALSGVQISLQQQIELQPAMAPYREVMEEWAQDIFQSEEANNAFARTYAEVLSEADLRQLIEFYQTPVGKRLAEKQVELTLRGADVGRRLAEAHQTELLERIQARTAELEGQ